MGIVGAVAWVEESRKAAFAVLVQCLQKCLPAPFSPFQTSSFSAQKQMMEVSAAESEQGLQLAAMARPANWVEWRQTYKKRVKE